MTSTVVTLSLRRAALYRFMRNRLALTGLIVVLVLVVIVLLTDIIAPFKFSDQSEQLNAPPGSTHTLSKRVHWMGTDDLGRDLFTRLLHGTRVTLLVGLSADVIITLVGVVIGLTAGYFGGLVDDVLMRVTDIMYAFPSLLFAMVVVAVFGRTVFAILLALGIANWVGVARLVRGQVLYIKQMDYVLSARSIGANSIDIVVRHILPNVLGPIIVLSSLLIPGILTAEAALAFLGVGIDPSIPTLGRLINSGMAGIFSRPWQVLFPVIVLTVLTLAFTLIGDGLRDALNPRLQSGTIAR